MIRQILKSILTRLSAGVSDTMGAKEETVAGWSRDPLSHPVLDAMSLSELADLPAQSLRACGRQ